MSHSDSSATGAMTSPSITNARPSSVYTRISPPVMQAKDCESRAQTIRSGAPLSCAASRSSSALTRYTSPPEAATTAQEPSGATAVMGLPSSSVRKSFRSRYHISSIRLLSGSMFHTVSSGVASSTSTESPTHCICQPSCSGVSSFMRAYSA